MDDIEQRLLEPTGDYSGLLLETLGWEVTETNAKKYVIGIRKYLNTRKESKPVTGAAQRFEINEDGSITDTRLIRISEEDKKNPLRLLELHGYDTAQWRLKKAHQSIWNGQRKDSDPVELYSSRIEIIPMDVPVTSDQMKEIFASLTPPKLDVIKPPTNGNVLVEPSILDFHLGKSLSLEDEVALYKNTVLDMLGKLSAYNICPEKFLFQIGQDFIHIDSNKKTTTAGTVVDSPREWSEIYRSAVELLLWTVDHFRQLAPVDCFYVPGNHDKMLSYFLALNLDTYYRNCTDVIVDVVDYPRKYYKYGANLIGMSHGREEGKRIEKLMQQEAADLWQSGQYREFHLGDLHHEQAKEDGGIIFRRTSSVTDLDGWHISKGYRAIRKAPMYVWDKNGGFDMINVVTGLK